MSLSKITLWLKSSNINFTKIEVASADASFRSYYRLFDGDKSFIVMDSSLQKESLVPFVDITHRLQRVGVSVPVIYKQSLDDGFLLLEDLGNEDLLDSLREDNFESYYKKAIDEIIKMQEADTLGLPSYNAEFLGFEMELMQEWYLEKYLGFELEEEDKTRIKESIENILEGVLSQPQGVFVHRDFHSRNIMLRSDDSLAVIDYQDARVGAITYDLVSLLRDCYIEFDRKKIENLALYFRDQKGLEVEDEVFIRWFDFMGLQRHIKVLGIFARLSLRDGKDGYLDDIPQTLKYILSIAIKYPQTKALVKVFDKLGIINKKGNE